MAEPDQRPDEQDDSVDRSSDDAGAVSESGSLDDDGSSEYGDAIVDEATTGDEHSDLADADPRTSGYAGGQAKQKAAAAAEAKAEEDHDPEDGGADATAAEVAAASTTTGTRAEKVANKKKQKESGGKASRSGNPAKAAKGDAPTRSKVGRTPVKPKVIGNRWAAPAMLICAGIGLAWIVVFYVTQDRVQIPWYSDLGSWNLVIGMGFIVAAFGFSMKWE
ncbi:cell division protein CrgA [Solicola sp. PLA-1-18]|uniref:cell division protein CrgA n=1 Tax=Solicola sp. PLA-1-18 TaxID=3380532 RepID=UPI003B797D86